MYDCKWADRSGSNVVAVNSTRAEGESLDDGLGSLPHYSLWKNTYTTKSVQLAVNGWR